MPEPKTTPTAKTTSSPAPAPKAAAASSSAPRYEGAVMFRCPDHAGAARWRPALVVARGPKGADLHVMLGGRDRELASEARWLYPLDAQEGGEVGQYQASP